MRRAFLGRCPHCGEGRLYRAYLKVVDRCAACGCELGRYRADDGPAYFTILIVGHAVVLPTLLFPVVWEASPWIVAPILLSALTVITLAFLPRVKGAVVGLLYSLGITGEQAPGSELAASEIGVDPESLSPPWPKS
jgi:uncharacterized protein (DUF983 family)